MAAPELAEQSAPVSAAQARARARAARNRTASRKRAPRQNTSMVGIAVHILASRTPERGSRNCTTVQHERPDRQGPGGANTAPTSSAKREPREPELHADAPTRNGRFPQPQRPVARCSSDCSGSEALVRPSELTGSLRPQPAGQRRCPNCSKAVIEHGTIA